MADERTLDAYAAHARDVIDRDWSIPSPLAEAFRVAFRPGAKVLDVGAGAGRELVALLRERYDAYGVEPVEALRREAISRTAPGRVFAGGLPRLEQEAGAYDGVVCSAVLQHLPRSQLFEAALELRGLLRAAGRALIAIPLGERPGLDRERDGWGRLFTALQPEELQLLFERVGFATLARWDRADALSRPGLRWATFLFEATPVAGARPIDQLATILSTRERKVATYKLALLRALNELAMTQPLLARWKEDGWVEVPLDALATRWVHYYWRLFDQPVFLPQQQGDEGRGAHRLGFSAPLGALIARYGRQGGLAAFSLAERDGLEGEDARLHAQALKALRRTILEGPVKHAGGALAAGPLLRRGGPGVVLVPGGLWRELSLLGHWVADALLLRWAELVERLSARRVSVAQVLPALLPAAPGERETAPLRALFSDGAACVWTGALVRGRALAIDHVLPWAHWHNNELWNLVPSAAAVNGAKADALPERRFLQGRRGAFLEVWARTRGALPERFRREAEGQLGRPLGPDEAALGELFEVLCEAVERTRLQRGLPAWTPRAA